MRDTGFSSDTLIFHLVYDERGESVRRGMVIRLKPLSEFGVFPEYDVALQFRVMKALADTQVPVPRMLWLEEDPAPLGSPFYMMEKLEGCVPLRSSMRRFSACGSWPESHASSWARVCSRSRPLGSGMGGAGFGRGLVFDQN